MTDHGVPALRLSTERTGMNLLMGSKIRTKVIIFDHSQMGCELLAHELEKSPYGIEVVGYSSSSQVIPLDVAQNADIALISCTLREGPKSGFNVLRALRQLHTIRCIMLLNDDTRELVLNAFRWGASGICGRNDSCEVLCKCIRRVHEGQVWANNQQVHYLLQAFESESLPMRGSMRREVPLTKRERDIVELVMVGKTNRDIAHQLDLSEHTIKNHLFRLFRKLGVSSRSELVAHTIRHRQMQPPGAA
jgi:DNA-binding NarL/FixJ family response regulator